VVSLLAAIDTPDIYGALSQVSRDQIEVIRVTPSPTKEDVVTLYDALGEGLGIRLG
jgi:hypothetical protein